MLRQTGQLLMIIVGLTGVAGAIGETTDDHRAWQHGIDLVWVRDKLLVVWGSAGNPPRPNLGGDWPHDVYYAWLDTPAKQSGAAIEPKVLVSRPEAQEPPSVAINGKGTLLMTSEDGNGGINQHAGLWDASLQVLRKYPFTIKRGGHSGHVAAMGERFLVTYGEDWVDGGGWLGLGTGKKVYARMVDNQGKLGREIKLTPDDVAVPRDSWPLVAGSDRNWLVVWQRYPGLTLQAALIDPSGAVIKRHMIIDGLPLRYTYDVEFSPELAMYVVSGTSSESGFIALISLSGTIVKIQRGLPPMASESRIILGWNGSQQVGVYPVKPHGIAVVNLSSVEIKLAKLIGHPYAWDYMGTTGVFVAPGQVLFATLSTTGMQVIPVNLRE